MITTPPRTVLSTQQIHGPVRPRVSPWKELSAGRGPHVELWLGGHQGGRRLCGGQWWAQGSDGAVPVARTHEAALLGCLRGSTLWELHTLAPQVWVPQSFSPTNCILSRFPNCSSQTVPSPWPGVPRALEAPLCEGTSADRLFPALWDCSNCGHTLIRLCFTITCTLAWLQGPVCEVPSCAFSLPPPPQGAGCCLVLPSGHFLIEADSAPSLSSTPTPMANICHVMSLLITGPHPLQAGRRVRDVCAAGQCLPRPSLEICD